MLSTVLPALPATAAPAAPPANNDHASHGKQPSSPPSGHMKELFLDEDRFEMLSGPAKTALERRFGSRYAEVAPNTDPLATPLAPTDVPTLVNDPSVDTTARDTQSETTIALAGPNIVTSFNDSGSFNSNNHFTGWSTAPTSSPTFTDNGILPASTEGDAGDPVIAVDSVTNRVYLVTLGFTTGENLQVFRSDTNGLSFAAPVNATPGYAGSGTFQDKEWIAVDNNPGTGQGNVYIAWRTFPSSSGGGIRFTRSTDHGDTWGPTLGTTISSVSSVQGAYVVVGTDHSVSVFYFQAGALMVTKSTDFGVTFASPVQVTTIAASGTNGDLGLGGGFRTSAFPTAAVNPVNGNLYVVWNDRGASTDKADVFLTRSTDGGATWSPRVRVNDDAGLNDQFMPTLAVSPDGSRVFFGWYDRRNDPTNLGIQRFGSVASVDGGTGAVTTGPSFAMSPMFPVVVGQDPNINT
ncbi:MAG: hypothetical protein QOG64_1943, partial [Acidimicrobiaceae bacterium]|nr:hypothetical protein [Acidimicrobiaceae bacterium]